MKNFIQLALFSLETMAKLTGDTLMRFFQVEYMMQGSSQRYWSKKVIDGKAYWCPQVQSTVTPEKK